ncbi:PGF-CTERM sorting domain-containing protein (plasmid) [Halococcus dombrowskii]|jgi:PGF-CTERM protein|uniref:PGF-CTERM sorting domain-containing protein n=1 Tax=Halococcus dombrowskii TaxID=179637 RepID=A0AAV3SDQ1_HALDO|nr:PGF-CTERM sorting domain-containing protein [Halococcus dombrowskii]UOO97191.1 PGF-CTERM sorting domain-containing protein [Halococcus dombrowskii]
MRTSTLTATLVMTLLLISASASGALAATVSLQGQQSPTETPGTEINDSATTVGAANQSGSPSITINNQQTSGQSILIQSVTIPQPGFIVIYDSSRSGNETNQIIGSFHLLGSGTFQNIPVPLDTSINQSTSLTAVIHRDTNSNGRFDYVSSNGTQDRPLTPQGDRRIVDIAQVTIQNSSDSGGATSSGNDSGTDANSEIQTASGGDGGTTETARNTEARQQGTEVGGPGFGLIVGVVALLAVALLAVRRT